MTDPTTLCGAHAGQFLCGAAISDAAIEAYDELIPTHFNAITAEGDMKWEPIQPEEGSFTFGASDRLFDFAEAHGMAVRAHAPLWHMQTPDWIFRDGDRVAPRELVLERIDAHFGAFCGRYRDRFFAWDVVNEAVDDHSEELYRHNPWFETIGPDYLDEAFRLARSHAPDVQLVYNDYNTTLPYKHGRTMDLLRGLLDRGVPVDGMGIQAHMNIVDHDLDSLERAIVDYAGLGLRVHLTELDVTFYSLRDRGLPATVITEEMVEAQESMYRGVFALARRYSDVVDCVTTWGVADDRNWLDTLMCPGRAHAPLLFYQDHRPKPVLRAIVEDAAEGVRA